MKKSQKRDKIIESFRKRDLLTANEICELLPEIDRATIYRNLAKFVELGTLREVNILKGISSYELVKNGDEHQHFICENCEKVLHINFNLSNVRKFIPQGVSIKNFEINLRGLCEKCFTQKI